MKKNLMTVIILALVLANLVLTAILAFTIIPQTKKSNELINQVCAAIDLELAGGYGNIPTVPIENIEVYTITDGFTVNLSDSGDGKKHYAVFSIGLSVNTMSEYYATYGGLDGLATKEAIIRNEINAIVSKHTVESFNADGQKAVKDEILESMQSMFGGGDLIVGVNFSSVTTE